MDPKTDEVEIKEKSLQCIVFNDKTVQTDDNETKEDFHQYEYQLSEHRVECCGTLNMFTEPGLPVPHLLVIPLSSSMVSLQALVS